MNKERLVRRAKPEDAQAIWNLYLETGFLYQGKLEAIGGQGREALTMLETLLKLNHDDYCISLCTDECGKLLSACTYARFSDTEGWQMHLASAHNSLALGAALEASCNQYLTSDAAWVSYTFRENNRSVRRLFQAACTAGNEKVGNAAYDYFIFDATQTEFIAQTKVETAVRKATEKDRLGFISALSHPAINVALRVVGNLDDGMSVKQLAGRLADHGLVRKRQAFVTSRDGMPVGMVIIDLAPKWWNFSNLSTSIRIFLLRQDEAIARTLLAVSAQWFREHSVDSGTMLVGKQDVALHAALAALGLVSQKKYERIEAPLSLAPAITNTYVNFIRRTAMKPARAEFARLTPREVAVCTM